MSIFRNKVYDAVKKIPKGKVCTYGQIALMAGSPFASRAVGNALHNNPDPENIPCHRVVFSTGNLSSGFAFGGKVEHKLRLENEGVEVSSEYKVDLKKYQFVIE